MGINILIVDTPVEILNKLADIFKGHCSCRINSNNRVILIIQTTAFNAFNDTSTYSNLSEHDLATLEFLPDFDTRYTYLLSLALGSNA